MARKTLVTMEDLYTLKPRVLWSYFRNEHFSFWMICGYLFVEYVRPQSIVPAIDIVPWGKLFLVLSFVGAIVDPTVSWVRSSANKWIIFYLIIVFLSILGAEDKAWSYNRLDLIYTWVLIYFLIINIVNTKERLFVFLILFVLASFKISLSLSIVWARRGFAFTSWGLMGPPGFFQNSGELAIQMSVFFPIAYVFAEQLRPHVSKKMFFILALMPITAAMTILGASSRGGQIALVVQLILMFSRFIFRPKALIPLVAVLVVAYQLLPEEQRQRFAATGTDRTSQQRLNYWHAGWEMLNSHPWLGVGFYNFPPYFEKHYPEKMLYNAAQQPHNIFVQVGSELGYLGLLTYLILMKNCFIRSRASSPERSKADLLSALPRALNISIIGFFVAGQFVSVVYYPFMWIHLALAVCAKAKIVPLTDGNAAGYARRK